MERFPEGCRISLGCVCIRQIQTDREIGRKDREEARERERPREGERMGERLKNPF